MMGENTKIEWAHHTFNPWYGCQKVGPGCDHCYAEGWAKRSGLVQWGPAAERRRSSAANWRKPLAWNAEAKRLGIRYRVFCASLADVFDNNVPHEWRGDLFRLIRSTPNLDWLLLTKRIGNAHEMTVDAVAQVNMTGSHINYWDDDPWQNVWIGATIVNQEEANRDIPKLLRVPARVRFLSMEPLLGPVDLEDVPVGMLGPLRPAAQTELPRIDWVVAGGESGPHARPSHPDWFRILRDQCNAAEVPFFFKQMGGVRDKRGALKDLPEDLRIREFPHANT